jgi:mono/diheme cytochrome c family protein
MRPTLLRGPLLLSLALLAASVFAADSRNGQALYESRCVECHKETAIGPDGPKVKTLEGLRLQVKLWDSLAGGLAWNDKDVADVVAYLNQKFYHY